GISVIENEKEHFSRWREFLLLCSIPSFLALFGLLFMPESPRYLLEAGREVEAMLVYQRIYKSNHSNHPEARYTLSELELPTTNNPAHRKQSRSGSKSLPVPVGRNAGIMSDFAHSIENFWSSFMQLFAGPTREITLVLLVVWFTESFGFYGLSLWFPEYLKALKMDEYDSNVKLVVGETYVKQVFNGTLDNVKFVNSTFTDVTFHGIVLNHVEFTGCLLNRCEFSDVVSSRTFFKNSTLIQNHFADTDMYPYRATGYGFLSAVCRIAGILGSLTFGNYIGVSRAIPMLTTAAVLLIGAIASIRIPETKDILL
ncbi:unnamed protein product, partial [Notodromas monacha]